MRLKIRRSALLVAVLLTPFLGLAQDGGASSANQAAPVVPPAAVKKAKKTRKVKPPKEDAGLKKERLETEKVAWREKRGVRLREKGEALGGGHEQRLLADGEKKEAQDDKDKRANSKPQRLADSK